MKSTVMLIIVMLIACYGTVSAQICDWRNCPPVLTYPAPNDSFPKTECADLSPLLHTWELAEFVNPDSVVGFIWECADSPPNPINFYDPDPAGGTCGWHGTTSISMPSMSYAIECGHQEIHEPVYWRVRTVNYDGSMSNWAVSYYRVEGFGEHYLPPTITSPQIKSYPKNTGLYHAWNPVPGASYYEVAFANAPPHTLALFDDCKYDYLRNVGNTTSSFQEHNMVHVPVYFFVRAVFVDSVTKEENHGNWAIGYYFVDPLCSVGVEPSSWGAIKAMHK